MTDAWVPGFILTLLFGLLSSLQHVSANEVIKCTAIISCPKGFRCCEIGCCLEKKTWDPSNEPFMILFVIFAVMLPLLCICGVARRFCHVCRPQQNLGANHQAPPEPPSDARIWVTDLDPPPPYSQVVPKSTRTEPPPPYSLVDPIGQVRNATI